LQKPLRGAALNALKAPSHHLRLSPFLFSSIHSCKLPPILAWAAASQELQGTPPPGSYSHLSLCPSLCLAPSGAHRNSNLKYLRHYRCTESMRACVYVQPLHKRQLCYGSGIALQLCYGSGIALQKALALQKAVVLWHCHSTAHHMQCYGSV